MAFAFIIPTVKASIGHLREYHKPFMYETKWRTKRTQMKKDKRIKLKRSVLWMIFIGLVTV